MLPSTLLRALGVAVCLCSYLVSSYPESFITSAKNGYACPSDIVSFYCIVYGEIVWWKDGMIISRMQNTQNYHLTRLRNEPLEISTISFINLTDENSLSIGCSNTTCREKTIIITILRGGPSDFNTSYVRPFNQESFLVNITWKYLMLENIKHFMVSVEGMNLGNTSNTYYLTVIPNCGNYSYQITAVNLCGRKVNKTDVIDIPCLPNIALPNSTHATDIGSTCETDVKTNSILVSVTVGLSVIVVIILILLMIYFFLAMRKGSRRPAVNKSNAESVASVSVGNLLDAISERFQLEPAIPTPGKLESAAENENSYI